MILRTLAASLLLFTSLAALPARAQGSFFEDSSLFSPIVTPKECAAGYALMAQLLPNSDFFGAVSADEAPSADDYTQRKNVLGQRIAEQEGSLDAAEQAVAQTYQTMAHFLSIMIDTNAVLELDGFARFVSDCDTAFGFAPSTTAYVRFQPRPSVPVKEQSPFNPALYETEASCAAAYGYLADLLNDAGNLGLTDPATLGPFADNLLTTTQPWTRADALRAKLEDAAAYDAADEVFALFYGTTLLLGPDRWDFAALAAGLTRCDRAYGFAPLTRRMLTKEAAPIVTQMGNCLAGFDLAYEINPDGEITASRTPLKFRERLYQRAGASYYPDLADMAEDQAKDFVKALRASPSMMVEEQFQGMVEPCM